MKTDPKAMVKVSGSATTEFLAPGIFVRFKGDFDKRGKATEEVKDMEIFTPDAKNPVGALAAGGAFEEPKKGAGPAAAATPTSLSVAGRITAVKKNNITVACGNMTVKADVAADATIKSKSPASRSPRRKTKCK